MNTNSLVMTEDWPRVWAAWAYRIALFIAPMGLIALGADNQTGEGSPLRQGIWLFLLALSLPALSLAKNKIDRLRLHEASMLVLLLLALYCLMSASWSAVALTSFKRALLLMVVICIAYAVFGMDHRSDKDFLKLCAGPLLCLLGFSFGAALFDPGYAITPIGWRGVTSHKNEFGQVSAMSLLCLVCQIGQRPWRFWWPATLIALSGLILARSATCIVAMVAAFSVMILVLLGRLMLLRWRVRAWILGLALLFLATGYVLLMVGMLPPGDRLPNALFSLLDRSSNLTGRTLLWTLVLDNSRYHSPWLGGGYGGFWNGAGGVASYITWTFPGGYVGQAHNGYIDLFNDLGYLGLIGLTVFFLVYWRNIMAPAVCFSREGFFHLGFVVFIMVLSCTESVLLRTTQLLNLILIISFIRVAMLARKVYPNHQRAYNSLRSSP